MLYEYTPKDLERFLSKVPQCEGCQLFQGSPRDTGYASFWFQGRQTGAHQFAYFLAYGPIPDGLIVIHLCSKDYPYGDITYRRCCNPAHLTADTYSVNNKQRFDEGRVAVEKMGQRGEVSHRAKMTEADVLGARSRFTGKHGEAAQLAREFGIHPVTMGDILSRRIWKHI